MQETKGEGLLPNHVQHLVYLNITDSSSALENSLASNVLPPSWNASTEIPAGREESRRNLKLTKALSQ